MFILFFLTPEGNVRLFRGLMLQHVHQLDDNIISLLFSAGQVEKLRLAKILLRAKRKCFVEMRV